MTGAAGEHVAPTPAALRLSGVAGGYGRLQVVHGIDIAIERGRVHALIGPNGAGKTTLLRIAAGVLPATAGTVALGDRDVTRLGAAGRARGGLCLIPEGRGVFASLTVRQNLALQVPRGRRGAAEARVFEAFPPLGRLLHRRAGTLSGGEQQMLALSRCFMSDPAIVLLDEVSMGLAPKVVDEIFSSLSGLASTGTAVLLVEQYVNRALEMAQTAQLINQGVITYSGPAADLDEAVIVHDYLGDHGQVRVRPDAPVTPNSATNQS